MVDCSFWFGVVFFGVVVVEVFGVKWVMGCGVVLGFYVVVFEVVG